MRTVLFVVSLAGTLAADARAQVPPEFMLSVIQSTEVVQLLSDSVAVGQRPPLGQAPTRRRCCSVKGALIGAAIGAAVGFGFARLCDASDCTSTSIKSMAILGGIGAGIGVMTAHPNRDAPFLPRASPGVALSPHVFGGTYRGVLVGRF
jgi:hypothetical protein